jgi:thiamine-monophosphate kinase
LKIKELGEFNLIERIRQSTHDGTGVCRGIGDDAAIVTIPMGHNLLTSTDMLIEGVHFNHDWTTAEDLGHKAVAVNLSDIAAMGGTPRYLYIGLACPGETDVSAITAFMRGALAEAESYDISLVGGDTCSSPGPWIISVTIEGSVKQGKQICRDGARPGDLIMVSGTLGDSALALRALKAGQAVDDVLAGRHHRPKARVAFGQKLGQQGFVSAMIDISDGLAGDLEHILQASRVDAFIVEDQLPLSELFQQQAENAPELKELALYGGEDYELLFTVAPENEAKAIALGVESGLPVTKIGAVKEGSGALSLQDRSGSVRPILVRGYDHFCRPERGS